MKKRVLSILLCLCMVLALCPVTAFADVPPDTIVGDIDLDGTVTIRDAIHLQNYLEGLESFTDKQLVVADFNGDGVVNYSDLTELQSYLELPASAITVTNGKATACGTEISKAAEGTRVTLTADSPPDGMDPSDAMVFDKWIVGSGSNVTLADANSATTTFTMSKDPVSVTATYKPLSASETGSLAITVDGFEVGNTPADCTYSFESTIPGVTFSENDIMAIVPWEKYVSNGESYAWTPVYRTEVFEAGTRYRFNTSLNNKGLELAPAVTVNGKTPGHCALLTFNGEPYALGIICDLGHPPMPPLTIDGPDVVCAQQDYEFTVTPPAGVSLTELFWYDTGMKSGLADLDIDDDGVGHGVVSVEWYDLQTNQFTLTARGTDPYGDSVPGTKTVQVSPEHIYVDGVCGCGAVQQYTVTYDGGEGVEGSIPAGVKTHGEDFTLSSETFTMDGFVQTGWVDKEGAVYKLGATYTADQDVTLYPVFEKIITLTVPYTTTVELSDVGVPGEKTFTLALIGDSASDKDKSNVTVSGSVTSNGKGSYNGALTITGPEGTLWHMLSEGAFVQQVDDGEAGWTVDDTVWGVLMEEIPVAYAVGDDAVASKYTVYAVPASIDGQGNYTIDWENVQKADMAFTNTYTDHVYELKHDATHHWDECACKDVQNKELHQYGDWTVTKAATETEEGQRERTCTVCDYKQTETIPVLEHTHDYTQKYDKTNHWDECDCGDIQNKEAHKYGEWKVTRKATETAKGEKEHTCTVCGYTEKAEIAKLGTVGTGDDSNIALWFALFTLSAAAAVITTATVSKKKKADR